MLAGVSDGLTMSTQNFLMANANTVQMAHSPNIIYSPVIKDIIIIGQDVKHHVALGFASSYMSFSNVHEANNNYIWRKHKTVH